MISVGWFLSIDKECFPIKHSVCCGKQLETKCCPECGKKRQIRRDYSLIETFEKCAKNEDTFFFEVGPSWRPDEYEKSVHAMEVKEIPPFPIEGIHYSEISALLAMGGKAFFGCVVNFDGC
jgi:hypothetical protein